MAEIRAKDQFVHEGFSGLRNNIDSGEFALDDLETALNVEINDAKVIQRRKGFGAPVVAGSYHSLWSGAGMCVAATGTSLKKIAADYSTTTLRSDLTATRPLSYYAIGARGYYSNGVQTGVLENGASRSWGLEVPPRISATAIGGTLRAGKYQFALAYERSDGQESGASQAGVIELATVGGLRFSNLPVSTDPDVTSKTLFVSRWNGETLYRRASMTNATTSIDVTDDGLSTLPLLTQHLSPAPAGDIVSHYNGRMLVASGNVLAYSEPYSYELFDRRATLTLESDITLLASVSGGLFVGTENATMYLQGDDMARVSSVPKADYGVIPGTLALVQADTLGDGELNGTAFVWASKQGLCAGWDGGGFRNFTQERFAYPTTDRGAGLVRRHRGMNQFVVTLQGTAAAGNVHG